jgi:uncharacterized protein (UPF0332 family)
MFYVAQAYLLEHNLSFSKHSGVISAFGRLISGASIVPREIHRNLSDAFDLRGDADYDVNTVIDAAEVLRTIGNASAFLGLAEQHFGSVSEYEDD